MFPLAGAVTDRFDPFWLNVSGTKRWFWSKACVAGQQVLVVEAMKMQNELRAPRAGRVERLAGAVGQNVDVGDLLVVIT